MTSPAAFSEADYQRAVDAVQQALQELENELEALPGTIATACAGYLPPIRDGLVWFGGVLAECGRAIAEFAVEALRGAVAPVFMAVDATSWTDVKSAATGIQGALRVDQLPVRDHWKGVASDRYALAVASQSGAAGRVAAVADSTAGTLAACAGAGTVFYIAVAATLAEFLTVLGGAVVEIVSGVFTWAGLLTALAEAQLVPKALTFAKAALVAFLATQVTSMVALLNQARDNSVFTGGHWPRAVTEAYSDATVTDGDAEWSFSR
jgi:uncharacterized protein YukE